MSLRSTKQSRVYGTISQRVKAERRFSDFGYPSNQKLGFNAGIIFGWSELAQDQRTYNVLITFVDEIGTVDTVCRPQLCHVPFRIPRAGFFSTIARDRANEVSTYYHLL